MPVWVEIVRALGPVIIGLAVVYIAYQQWKVNQATLKEKLFEKRFAVFTTTQVFLSQILRTETFTDETLREFNNAPQLARFLFDKEIAEYLKEIRKRALNMRLNATLAKKVPISEDERAELITKENNELKWLSKQPNEIFNKFEPFLGFGKHK